MSNFNCVISDSEAHNSSVFLGWIIELDSLSARHKKMPHCCRPPRGGRTPWQPRAEHIPRTAYVYSTRTQPTSPLLPDRLSNQASASFLNSLNTIFLSIFHRSKYVYGCDYIIQCVDVRSLKNDLQWAHIYHTVNPNCCKGKGQMMTSNGNYVKNVDSLCRSFVVFVWLCDVSCCFVIGPWCDGLCGLCYWLMFPERGSMEGIEWSDRSIDQWGLP